MAGTQTPDKKPTPPKPSPPSGGTTLKPTAAGDNGKVRAAFVAMFAQFGISTSDADLGKLADAVMNYRQQKGNTSLTAEDLLAYARQSGTAANVEYQKLFPNIDKLAKQGSILDTNGSIPVNEANYMHMYQAYATATKDLQGYGQASTEQASQWMLNGVSPMEVTRRVAAAKEFAQTAPEAQALKQYYGVDTDAIATYLLDPTKGHDEITKQVQSVRVGAAAATQASIDLSKDQAQQYATDVNVSMMDPSALQKMMADAGMLNRQDSLLANIDQQSYKSSDAIDAILLNDQQKKMASQQRAQREAARFGGSSGVSAGSLGGNSI